MTHLWSDVFSILFAMASVFLIFIVLLQRGRGGGLARLRATGVKAPLEPRRVTFSRGSRLAWPSCGSR